MSRSAISVWKKCFFILALLSAGESVAQEIPRDQYLKFLPLSYPALVDQTAASQQLHLYGDPSAPGYRDVQPKDGIDDLRDRLLTALTIRFAPWIVQNTPLYPMDFQKMMEIQKTSTLYVDRWDVSNSPPRIADSFTVDLFPPNPKPCSTQLGGEDCKLLSLLHEFYPDRPSDPWLSRSTRPPDHSLFSVLYFNFSGSSPETWKEAYQNPISGRIREQYQGIARTYVHPFLFETSLPSSPIRTYELALQYWFFYPYNDAGNKHEGDWEHISVIVSPLSRIEESLTSEDIQKMLARPTDELGGADPLVIKRIDYYMHNKVMALDFSKVNAYLPKPEWDKALKARKSEIVGDRAMLRDIRKRAWADPQETRINTHPVVYMGEGKGLELLLSPPGARNKDSHASYPFTGLYKDLGPAAAAEEVNETFNHQKYMSDPSRALPENIVRYDLPERIEIVPDWERVARQVLTDYQMRRKWAWMILPIHWGYPATKSPFAGIVPHADTGNISPVGPSFSSSWNRPGTALTFSAYHPHRYPGLLPISPIDNLQNNLGWLNAPALILTTIPPLDMVFELGFLPFRAALGTTHPTFYPADRVPFRLISVGVGYSWQFLNSDQWSLLFGNSKQLPELRAGLNALDPSGGDAVATSASTAGSMIFDLNFHIGDRFVVENSLHNSKSELGIDVALKTRPQLALIRGTLDMWELTGRFRYNFATGGFQPYAALGYGWVWYRLLNVTLDGTPIADPDSDYIRQPSIVHFQNLLPNAWSAALGFEFIPIKSTRPLPQGIDFSVRVEGTWTVHSLGLSFADQAALGLNEPASTVTRWGLNLYGLLSF